MLECYLDEHYQQKTGLYVVGVLGVDDSSLAAFEQGMKDIRAYARNLTGIQTAELHAYDIYHATNDYSGVGIGESKKILRDAIKLIASVATKMCIKPINTSHQNYRASGHAHIWALSWACEHMEIISDSSGWRLTPDDHPQLNGRVIQSLAAARRAATRNCIRFRKLSGDSPIITKSHQSLGLQACDIALFCYGRARFDAFMGNTGKAAKFIEKLVNMLATSGKLCVKQTWP